MVDLKRVTREAFATTDERQITRVESRIEGAEEVAWGTADLIDSTPEEFEDLVADLCRSPADIGDVVGGSLMIGQRCSK